MSFFKLGLDKVQEVLILALMLVFVVAVVYAKIDFTYKIGIGILVFSVLFLTTLANQVLKQQEEQNKLA